MTETFRPPRFYEQLTRHRVTQRKVALRDGALTTTVAGVLFLALLALAGSMVASGSAVLTLLVFGLGTGWLGLAAWFLVRPALARQRLAVLVSTLERRQPALGSVLSTALYLHERPAEAEEYRYSPALVAAVQRSADGMIDQALHRESLLPVFRWRDRLPQGLVLLGAVIFLCSPVGRGGMARVSDAFWGNGMVSNDAVQPLTVPGDLYVPRGRPLEFYATLDHPASGPPVLYTRRRDAWLEIPLQPIGAEKRRYFHRFDAVTESMDYVVTSEAAASQPGRIVALDQPEIVAWRAVVTPPAYTGLAPFVQDAPQPLIEAIDGATVEYAGTCSLPLRTAALRTDDAPPVPVERVEGTQFRGQVVVRTDTRLRLTLEDMYGQRVEREVTLHVVQDRPPVAVITSPPVTSDLPPVQQVLVRADAADDFGLAWGELVYQLDLPDSPPVRQRLFGTDNADVAASVSVVPATREVKLVTLLDLADVDLMPGDEVRYWIEVTDANAVSGPQTSRSAVHRLVVPALGDQYARSFERQSDTLTTVRGLLESQQQITDQVRRLRERAQDAAAQGKDENNAWMLRSEVQDLAQTQQQLADELEQVAREVGKQARELAERFDLSVRTVEKYQRIGELLNELLTDDMRRLLARFQEMVSQMEAQIDDQALQGIEFPLQDLEAQLDRTLSLLESSFLEQQVEALAQEVEQLLDRQRALEEETLDAAERPEDTTQAAAALAQRQAALEQQAALTMEKLARTAQQFRETRPDVAAQLVQAASKAAEGDLSAAVQTARELLERGDFAGAHRQQRAAGDTLSLLSDELKTCRNAATGAQGDTEQLVALCERAIALSGALSAQVQRMRQLEQRVDYFLVQLRNDLARGLDQTRAETRRLLADFSAYARNSPLVDYDVAQRFNQTIEAQSLGINRSRDGQSIVQDVRLAAQTALGALNEGIARLLESLSTATAGGGGGLQDYFRQMEQLIQQQRQLNARTEQLVAQPQVQNMLEEMLRQAIEQRMLRQQLQRLTEQYEQFSNRLGDLGGIQEQMAQVEQMIRQGEDLERIRQEQEQILQRLLDAGRSQEQDEQQEQRLAEAAAQDFYRPPADERALDRIDFEEQILRSAEGLSDVAVPVEYRDHVIDYFRRLAKSPVR